MTAAEASTSPVVSRAKKTTSYRDAAAVLWGEAGTYCHDSYDRQRHLFPELPAGVPIVCGITAFGKCLGLSRTTWEHGPRITIASNLFKRGAYYVDDVMTHEMLHCWLHLTGQDYAHNTEDWYTAVERLSPAVLGHRIQLRRGADRKSVRVKQGDGTTVVRKIANPDATPHKLVAGWPYLFRRADYNWGAPIDCPSY